MKSFTYLTPFLIAIFFTVSCRKQRDAPINIATDQITIDSVDVTDFTNISVVASLHILPPGKFRMGICWSKAPNPVVTNDTISQPVPRKIQLDTTVVHLDSNTVYHFRAFCITSVDTFYSVDNPVKTGGLSVIFEKDFIGGPAFTTPFIKQILSEGNNGFIVLSDISNMSGSPWSVRLTKIDLSGNQEWSQDYDINNNIEPDGLLALPDGYAFAAHSDTVGESRTIIYKTDLNGQLLWRREFKDTEWIFQNFDRLYENSASEIVLTSYGRKWSDTATGVIVLGPLFEYRFDQDGNLPHGVEYLDNVSGNVGSPLTTPASANGYIKVFDATDSLNSNGFKVQKFDTANALEWNKDFYPDNYRIEQIPEACLEDHNGNYAILISDQLQTSQLRMLDKSNGNILWNYDYQITINNYPVSTIPEAFALSPQNDYYIASQGPMITKVDPNGKYIWNFIFNYGNGNFVTPQAIFVYPNNEIYLFSLTSQQYTVGTMHLTKLQEY